MKRNFTFLAAVVLGVILISSCSKKTQVNVGNSKKLTAIEEPFSGAEYRTNKDYFRAVGEGVSDDRTVAKRIAELNAKQAIASQIQTVVRSVGEQYLQNTGLAGDSEAASSFEEVTRTVIDEVLRNIEIVDQQGYQDERGQYIYYSAMQMSKKDAGGELGSRISEDERLRIKFDQERFREIYEKELEEFSNGY